MTTWRPWSNIEIRSTLTIIGFHIIIILALQITSTLERSFHCFIQNLYI